MSQLEIRPVNKYATRWNPDTIFTGFKVRAVLIKSNDLITNIQEMHQLRRRLKREMGVEGEDWVLEENPHTEENELYLQNTGKLVMWKLQDNAKFVELFAFVEQHTDDQSVIDQWEKDQREAEQARREAEIKAREEAIKAAIEARRPPDEMPPDFDPNNP